MCQCCQYPGTANHKSYLACMEAWRGEAGRLAIKSAEFADLIAAKGGEINRLAIQNTELTEQVSGLEEQVAVLESRSRSDLWAGR